MPFLVNIHFYRYCPYQGECKVSIRSALGVPVERILVTLLLWRFESLVAVFCSYVVDFIQAHLTINPLEHLFAIHFLL